MVSVDKTLVLRYVIPFSFSDSYQDLFLRMEGNKVWNCCALPSGKPSVYAHLYRLNYGGLNDNSIGSTWEYAHRNKLPQLLYTEEKGAAASKWRISQMQIHLFHTNVGLAWYELEPMGAPPDLESLIQLQNRFKDCSYTDSYFTIKHSRRSKEEEDSFAPFDAAKWLGEVLAPLGEVQYLNGSCVKDQKDCPDRALIFNYVLLRSEAPITEKQLQMAAFWLANGYSRKYRPSDQVLQEGVHPFADVCMYASRSGCGYYAVANEGNQGLLGGNFNDSIRREYFFLYLLTLYQSFSLMSFSRRCALEFASDPQAYSQPDLGSRLDAFVAELNAFLMKGMYSSVSSVQHHNYFYQYLRSRLMIQEDIESLKIGTEALAQIQHARREYEESLLREQEDAEERQRDRRQNFALAVLSVFSLVAIFLDLKDLIDKLFTVEWAKVMELVCEGNEQMITQIVVHAAVFAGVAYSVYLLFSSFHTGRKKKNENKK